MEVSSLIEKQPLICKMEQESVRYLSNMNSVTSTSLVMIIENSKNSGSLKSSNVHLLNEIYQT